MAVRPVAGSRLLVSAAPHVAQVFLIERTLTVNGKPTYQAMLYVTSLTAEQADPADSFWGCSTCASDEPAVLSTFGMSFFGPSRAGSGKPEPAYRR